MRDDGRFPTVEFNHHHEINRSSGRVSHALNVLSLVSLALNHFIAHTKLPDGDITIHYKVCSKDKSIAIHELRNDTWPPYYLRFSLFSRLTIGYHVPS